MPSKMMTKLIRRSLLLALATAVLAHARAADPEPKLSDDTDNTEDIDATLDRRKRVERSFDGWQSPDWMNAVRSTRDRVLEKIRLDIGASYHVAGLVAIGDGDPDSGFSGDLTVIGNWLIAGQKWNRPLDLRFRVRYRHAIGGRAASEVADATGGLFWNMIDGFSDSGFEFPDFQLVQHLPAHDLEIRYGQMTIDSQFDRHALRSSKHAYFNRAFSSNPAVAFPRFGAGVTLVWKPDDKFDLSIGSSSVQGTQSGTQVDFDFDSSALFSAVQLGRDFTLCDNPARIQAMIWHSDALVKEGLPEGKGISLTFEHWLSGSNNRLFARMAWADGPASDADRIIAAGLAIEPRENDLFGIAVGAGRDSSGTKDWQAVVETFYRFRIGPHIQLTPEAQFIFGNGLGPDHSARLVAGIRGEIAF